MNCIIMICKGFIVGFLGLCLGSCGDGDMGLTEAQTFEQTSFQFSQVRSVCVSDDVNIRNSGFTVVDHGECYFFLSDPYVSPAYAEIRKITTDGQNQLLFHLNGRTITAALWDRTANQFVVGTEVESEELEGPEYFLEAYDLSGELLWREGVSNSIIDLRLVNQRYRVSLGPQSGFVIDPGNPLEAERAFEENQSDKTVSYNLEFDQTGRTFGKAFYENDFYPSVFVKGQEEVVVGSHLVSWDSQRALLLYPLNEKGKNGLMELPQMGEYSSPIDAVAEKQDHIDYIVEERTLTGKQYDYFQYHIDLSKEEPSCTLGVTSAELEKVLGKEIRFMGIWKVNSETVLAGSYMDKDLEKPFMLIMGDEEKQFTLMTPEQEVSGDLIFVKMYGNRFEWVYSEGRTLHSDKETLNLYSLEYGS